MNLRNLDAPAALTYLNEVKVHLKDDVASFTVFVQQVDKLLKGNSSQPSFSRSIVAIANILRHSPSLFRGINSILRNGDRVESPDNSQVTLFVLVNASLARIYSSSPNACVNEIPGPSTTDELLDVIASKQNWDQLLATPHSKEYFTCVSQLLQVLLDDLNTESVKSSTVYRCLRDLGDLHSILPPSIFMNHIRHDGQFNVIQGGASSDIYKGVIKGIPLCFRVLRMFDVPQEERDELYKKFCKEVLVWRQLRHPNILPFLGANTVSFRPQFCFISYWMNHGSIMSFLKKNPNHDRLAAINDIVAGIDYLHHLDPPVTHNDIKGANVLVTDALTCCLADFGLSLILESQRLGNKSPSSAGSICWMAPELMTAGEVESSDPNGGQVAKSKVDRKAGDIFALGCTIYEIYTGKPPHHNLTHMASVMYTVVVNRKRPEVPPPERVWTDTEVDMWWVVGKCWQHEPTMRPDIRLVKSYLEGLAANRAKKLHRSSPSPSVTGDISQEIVSANEMAKAQCWIREQMGSIVFKDLSQRRFDEPSKTKMPLIRGDAQVPSSKRPKVSVLAPIQLPAQTLDAERYPTPVSATEYVEKRRNPSTIERQMLRTRPKNREWTRARPPSPHPHYKHPSNSALLTPPDTPSLQTQEFILPPLPPKPEIPTMLKCPLDLDKPKIYYPTARRATRQVHKSRLREVVVETDYEADVDH